MSATVREDLAVAANTVDGVSCLPYFWQTTHPGSGMVRFGRQDWPNPLGGLNTWQVLIVLPSDIAQAEAWIDDNLPTLIANIGEHIAIRSAEPRELQLDSGRLPVLFIEGQRESE